MPSFEEIQKAKIAASFNSDEGLSEIIKAEILDIEKGGKRAMIGEKRTFGGREYIKTSNGWKFHGKGAGSKAQEHAAGALEHRVAGVSKHHAEGKKKAIDDVTATIQSFGSYGKMPSEKIIQSAFSQQFVYKDINKFKEAIETSVEAYKTESDRSRVGEKKDTSSFEDILSNPEGKSIIEGIEGLDSKKADHRALYEDYKKQLKDKFGYDYKSSEWDKKKDEKELFSEGSKFKWGGKYKSYTFEVVEDLGEDMKIINRTKGYRADPYIISKKEFKGAKLVKEE